MAQSAATLMCLGADTIYMGQLADLGPIDIQLYDAVEKGSRQFSPLDEFKSMEYLQQYAAETLDALAFVMTQQYGISLKEALHESAPCVSTMLRPLFERISPFQMGEHRRSLAIGEEYAKRLIEATGNEQHANLVRQMVWEYPSHDFSIDIDEARALNLPVEALTPEEDDLLVDIVMEVAHDGSSFHGFATENPAAGEGVSGTAKRKNELRQKEGSEDPSKRANGRDTQLI